jgi:hypothetical protein
LQLFPGTLEAAVVAPPSQLSPGKAEFSLPIQKFEAVKWLQHLHEEENNPQYLGDDVKTA